MFIKNMSYISRFATLIILLLMLLFFITDSLEMIRKYSKNYLFFISSVLGVTAVLYIITYLVMKKLNRK